MWRSPSVDFSRFLCAIKRGTISQQPTRTNCSYPIKRSLCKHIFMRCKFIEMLNRSCMWAVIKNCSLSSNNCLPTWICDCIMPEGETERLCQTCDLHCWDACPPWSQWTSVSSPRFWAAASEIRRRGCPCDLSQASPPGSRIFQSDMSTGHCLQARVLFDINSFSWGFLYVGLFLLCVLFMFWMRECVNEYKSKGKSKKENVMPQKTENYIE